MAADTSLPHITITRLPRYDASCILLYAMIIDITLMMPIKIRWRLQAR